MTGENDTFSPGRAHFHAAQDLQPGHILRPDANQNHANILLFNASEGGRGCIRADWFKPLHLEGVAKNPAQIGIVIQKQDYSHRDIQEKAEHRAVTRSAYKNLPEHGRQVCERQASGNKRYQEN
jgi:hypothetical protein